VLCLTTFPILQRCVTGLAHSNKVLYAAEDVKHFVLYGSASQPLAPRVQPAILAIIYTLALH
jgi:hypothetical protein